MVPKMKQSIKSDKAEKINVETIFKWSNVERDDELEF